MLQHESGSEIYLTVGTGASNWWGLTNWGISDSMDGWESWIESGSAGNSCPAHERNTLNNDPELKLTSWQYADGDGCPKNGDIRLSCKTHTHDH